jgi:hypothetical protein
MKNSPASGAVLMLAEWTVLNRVADHKQIPALLSGAVQTWPDLWRLAIDSIHPDRKRIYSGLDWAS